MMALKDILSEIKKPTAEQAFDPFARLREELFSDGNLDSGELAQLEELTTESDSFWEAVIRRCGLAQTVQADYYPASANTRIKLTEGHVLGPSQFQVTEQTQNDLKFWDSPGTFKITLKFKLKKGSLSVYEEVVTQEQAATEASKAYVGSWAAAGATALALLFAPGIVRPDTKIQSHYSPVSVTFHKASHYAPGLGASIEEFLNKTKAVKNPHVAKIRELLASLSDGVLDHSLEHAEHIASNAKTEAHISGELAVESVEDFIESLTGRKNDSTHLIAKAVVNESRRRNIDYRILLSILFTESSFNQSAKSNTGDVSVAQINIKTWTKAFPQYGYEPLDVKRLKADPAYAVKRMADVLDIYYKHRKPDDKIWFATYHSKTGDFKTAYAARVKSAVRKYQRFHSAKIENDLSSLVMEFDLAAQHDHVVELVSRDEIEKIRRQVARVLNSVRKRSANMPEKELASR